MLFIGTTSALIWLIAVNKGVISTILSNRLLCWIGNISPYAFLIHFVAIKYLRMLLGKLHMINWFTMLVLAASLTVCATMVWMKIESAYIKQRKKIQEVV